MWTSIAVLLVGIWLVADSQETPSTTLTLIFGLAVGILALVDLVPLVRERRSRP